MKTKYLYTIIGILLLAFLISANSCRNRQKEVNSLSQSISDNTKYHKNKIGTLTASKKVLELSNRNLKKQVINKNDSLKKLSKDFSRVKSIVKWKTKIQIDSIIVPFKEELPCEFKLTDSYKTKHLSFNYEGNKTGFLFTDFSIPNETFLFTGFERKWFLGKQTMITKLTHTNPLITSYNVESYTVRIPKRFYDTRAFNIGVGLIAGRLLR